MNISQLSFSVSGEVVWIIFSITALIVSIMSLVFYFHWNHYGLEGSKKIGIKALYSVGTAVLIATAYVLAMIYQP